MRKKQLRMIRLRWDVKCNRPKRCRRTTCYHYDFHEYDKRKCFHDCVFKITETARIVGWFYDDRKKKSVERKGQPFKLKREIHETVRCG